MKKKYLILQLLIVFGWSSSAQYLEWAKSLGGSSDDYGVSITVDVSGNVYAIGTFEGTVDFDPGAGTANLSSAGDQDFFVQKLDAFGNFLWAKSFGDSLREQGHSIFVDSLGNVYTTGYFEGAVDFDPGAGISILTSAGNNDVFVQKLDAGGNFIWAKSFGDSLWEEGNSTIVDLSGNVYTTGYFRGTVDFDPGAGIAHHASAGYHDIFVQKLDAAGNFIWAKTFGGNSTDIGTELQVDASGNLYLTGIFSGTVDFDPGPGTADRTSAGKWDIFVQKLDAAGNFLWAKSFGGTLLDVGESIAVDAARNVYSIGYFRGTVDFDPGGGTTKFTSAGYEDIFVQKLDAAGNFLWAKSFGGSSVDVGYKITVDASGNAYTTGSFKGTVDFDPGAGAANLSSAGDDDMFVQKLDASGNFLWAKSVGGSSTREVGRCITVDASGNIYTTGYFEGTVDFDPGAGTANLTSEGHHDVFFQKMNQGVTGLVEITKGVRIRAYPNPSQDLIQLKFEQALNNVEITLNDLQGKVYFKKHFDAVSHEQFNIYGPSGIYFLSVKTPQGQSVVKLIKE
ncbi:SBBP repeat-containing protein [Owenweeksia hongkongensis]|uniref:SBBP repeat-containing protein n=1 Tax=Owenweeksia hongkongensis TaxID=253245 RepID=UPI003A8F4D4A